MSASLTSQPKAFQSLNPIGGVAASESARRSATLRGAATAAGGTCHDCGGTEQQQRRRDGTQGPDPTVHGDLQSFHRHRAR